MDVRNCRECRRIFQYNGYGDILCPECRKKDEEEFDRVKNYLRQNPDSTQKNVCDETGVDFNKILRWLREERLVTTDAKGLGLKCEQCGAPICSGKLCDECKRKLAADFGLNRKSEDDAPKPISYSKKEQKMRFLNTRT